VTITESQQEKLQTHLEQVAAELGCVINQRKGLHGMMYVEERPPRVEIPTLESHTLTGIGIASPLISYYIGLHELGHVYHGHTQGRPPYRDEVHYFTNGVLKSEAEAWKYALDHAIIQPTKRERSFMLKCIMSYYKCAKHAPKKKVNRLRNGNRHWFTFQYDEPDEFFWQVAGELGYNEAQ